MAKVVVLPEHFGIVITKDKDMFSEDRMSKAELYEWVRGNWPYPLSRELDYIYFQHKGIIRAVYKVFNWVSAGTQIRFFRQDGKTEGWEFIGSPAPEATVNRYLGKEVKLTDSYETSYSVVGN